MTSESRTILRRRVRTLCICAWIVLVLSVPIYVLSTYRSIGYGRAGAGGSGGHCQDEKTGAVVQVTVSLGLADKVWASSSVGKIAEVRFIDGPPADEPRVLWTREEMRERFRPSFDRLCERRGCPELKPLFDEAIANGGFAEVTYPWLYISAAASRVLHYWWPTGILGVAITMTWLAALTEPVTGGLCAGCGYDLAGLGASKVCPECGKERG